MNQRQLFYQHLGQTSGFPLALEITDAEGIYLYGKNKEKYIDLISGISVNNTGHKNQAIISAIKDQAEKYMHLMVYGEYIQAPQVKLAELLSNLLPNGLDLSFFVNSGSEAIEGALKLAKRHTGRNEIICFKNAYHGSTHGALSVMGNEKLKNAFRPLLPGIKILEYNNINELEAITGKTACVLVEPYQAEAGIRIPSNEFIKSLRQKCDETGALLIFDEVQTGFGRTGTLFGFEHFHIQPDILVLAKGISGGMPLGAFISSKDIMQALTNNPVLGHITTFGGHPVSCAAAIANIHYIIENDLLKGIDEKEALFKQLLKHPLIKEVRGKGLFLAIEFKNFQQNKTIIDHCIKNGVITDWFLFCDESMRICPPLIITKQQIKEACEIIIKSIDESNK